MDFGIPKQQRPFDYRVGMTPMGVDGAHRARASRLRRAWSRARQRLRGRALSQAGAQIVYSSEEVYGRGQLILTVSRPTEQEFDLLQEGHILCGFLHLAVAHPGAVGDRCSSAKSRR